MSKSWTIAFITITFKNKKKTPLRGKWQHPATLTDKQKENKTKQKKNIFKLKLVLS